MSLAQYAGKVSVVVNVASACGYTEANYKGLTEIYDRFHSQGFEVRESTPKEGNLHTYGNFKGNADICYAFHLQGFSTRNHSFLAVNILHDKPLIIFAVSLSMANSE